MSEAADPELQQEIFAAYSRLYIENYCIVASSIWLFYDTIVTFPQEVQRIWNRRLTGATFIYFLTRYGLVAERICLMVSLFVRTTLDDRCKWVLRLDDSLTDLNYAAIGGFTALRLYGISGLSWSPLVVVVILWSARIGISIYLQTSYTPLAFGPPIYGCGAIWNDRPSLFALDTTASALVLASDSFLLIVTWVKTVGIRKNSMRLGLHTPLMTLLLRDGTLYFAVILVVQVLAIISSQVGSTFILWDVWIYFSHVITIIFLSRFMLNLRGVYVKTESGETSQGFTLSDPRFAENLVGNLGAPLQTSFIQSTLTTRDSSEANAGFDYVDDGFSDEATEVAVDPLSVGLAAQEEVEMKTPVTAPT